jgi:hypothetical protein
MRAFSLLISLFFFSDFTFSCCGEYNERYVPLGQLNGELYMFELKFNRNCRAEGAPGLSEDNQFFVTGVANIYNTPQN